MAKQSKKPADLNRLAAAIAGEPGREFVDEAHHTPCRVRRARAQAGMQDLAGVGPGGQQRVVAELAGVAVRGALLGVAVDLADRGVHIHHQRPRRSGAEFPGPGDRPAEDGFELEAFRTLRANLRYFNVSGRLQSILVSSPMPGDGKSTVARYLASTMASMGDRVVLVEADLHKRVISQEKAISAVSRAIRRSRAGSSRTVTWPPS